MPRFEPVVPAPVDELIAALPKVELHVHLEGSMQPALLLELAAKHGIAGLPASLEAVREWYEFRDFPHFIDVYLAAVQTLRDEEDFALSGCGGWLIFRATTGLPAGSAPLMPPWKPVWTASSASTSGVSRWIGTSSRRSSTGPAPPACTACRTLARHTARTVSGQPFIGSAPNASATESAAWTILPS